MNQVVSGNYVGKMVVIIRKTPAISLGDSKYVLITPEYVVSHSETIQPSAKSTSDRLKRGIVGGTLFGTKGALFGALTGKKAKSTSTSYQVFLTFKNHESSVLKVDERMHRVIQRSLTSD